MVAEGLPAQLACRVLDVSESGFHAWRARPPSQRAIRHAMLTDLIRQIHLDFRGVYGYRRVHAELTLGHGLVIGEEAVWLLMRKAGLKGFSGRPTYRRIPHQPTAGDLVDRDFARSEPDRLWVTDITEHPDPRGQGVLRGRARRVLSAGGGLVDRLDAERGAGHQRARHGHHPAKPVGRDGDPF
jgi:putative transposase